ncbi:DNA-binding transcriptional regulator Fis [Larsenimonas rhizosphaerae]|uniref:Putative Fis-like DNA-binding protein n=1 Tax=Larsenimonas rhizosphaerae TaxID=2944682 RepID=A0AA41ZKC6_9GAMM|nr:DNA-binding transcriptional regulator Fis [Larsenimonas rhizosphaerae]MCM2130852.1 DNA-binding transcriptional regulator Fis [Larsenimonas rhizosphaerae]MCX2523556.1 DNA-binding transcriptional regulator Fis [Larsenimonas rhizosphaerae]
MTSKPAIASDMIDSTPATIDPPRTLREAVEQSMTRYFQHLDGGNVTDLHAMVMAEVEAPLLQAVMLNTEGNQTLAAQMLGLNRGTLRKKLKQYDLI